MQRLTVILGAVALAGCGSSASAQCFTITKTGTRLCGSAAASYCRSVIKPLYGIGVGLEAQRGDGAGLAQAEKARLACLRVGVNLNA